MIEEFSFTVFGNQENEYGNPLGYHRTTQKSKWNDASQKYEAWKAYVQNAFMIKYFRSDDALEIKPLSTSKDLKARMEIEIEFANDARPDPDNVWKGIADALFKVDKYVSGSFEFKTSPDKVGRVKINIKRYKVNV